MSLVIATGYDWINSDISNITATKLNLTGTPSLTMGANAVLGRLSGAGTGDATEIQLNSTLGFVMNQMSVNQGFAFNFTGNVTFQNAIQASGGYKAADTSAGISTTITTSTLVGKTITVKNGIITAFA